MHTPRRRFSQNFLVDDALIDAIIDAIAPRADDRMAEIGPGLGALTRPLARVVRPLHVIEIDRDIVRSLERDYPSGALVIHAGDVLEFDFTPLGPDLRVVGNLPYHISTPILFHLARYRHLLRDIHVMLQEEVVDRMVAAPGASDYGRLSVMLQYGFTLEKVLRIPASAFDPQPKVESAIVRLTPRLPEEQRARSEEMLGRVVAAAFGQRRKTLRNTLRPLFDAAALENLSVDPGARAQELSVEDYVRLANALA